MVTLKRASLADAPAIRALMGSAPDELLPVPLSEIRAAIIRGDMVWDSGMAIMTRRAVSDTYYGIPVGKGSVQIMDLVSTTRGGGVAQGLMVRFLEEVGVLVFLLVKSDNQRGIAFYRKLGFEQRNEVRFKTFSSLLMVRDATNYRRKLEPKLPPPVLP